MRKGLTSVRKRRITEASQLTFLKVGTRRLNQWCLR